MILHVFFRRYTSKPRGRIGALFPSFSRRLIDDEPRESRPHMIDTVRKPVTWPAMALAGRLGLGLVGACSVGLGVAAAADEQTPMAAPVDTLTAALASARNDRCSIDSARTTDARVDARVTVTVRGARCDGRGFIKAILGGATEKDATAVAFDADLDIKVAALTGFNNAELRDVELRLSGHAGDIGAFALAAKVGPVARLAGELRIRSDGRRLMVVESDDAGALLRFLDFYPRMANGKMTLAFDAAAPNGAPREGQFDVRDFLLVGEAALRPLIGPAPAPARNAKNEVAFTHLRLSFKRSSGHLTIEDGMVIGPTLGATVTGKVDFAGNDLRLRGTLVPAYALASVIHPVEPNGEGLFALSYEIVGSPRAPTLRINPFGPLAPGVLRRLFILPPNGDGP
jgi:hypothetical protein